MPYFLYFQLLQSVDRFIVLDDVFYIKAGWINRNVVSVSGKRGWLTVPLEAASQNKLIKDISIAPDAKWKKRTLTTLQHSYSSAPFKNTAMQVFQDVISENCNSLCDFVVNSLRTLCATFSIQTKIELSSHFNCHALKGESRILEICKLCDADQYLNLPGGMHLYDKNEFTSRNIELKFIQPSSSVTLVSTFGSPYDGSILDLLFRNNIESIKSNLSRTSFL